MHEDNRRSQYKAAFYMAVTGSILGTLYIAYMLITKGLPESSEAKAAYVKFLIILAFFYFGSFLMRLRYKRM